MAISANQNSNLTEPPNSMAEWVVWAGAEVGTRQGAGSTVVISEDQSSGEGWCCPSHSRILPGPGFNVGFHSQHTGVHRRNLSKLFLWNLCDKFKCDKDIKS